MTCPVCAHDNRAGAKFCEEYAAPLKRSCAGCGAELRPTAKFCDECGAPAQAAGAGATPTPGPLSAARKVVTIIFADLVGSTALHERLDPESVRHFMASCYAAMRGAVEAYGGRVTQVMGDGVKAVFGAPRVAEDDALRAVRAGVAMQQAFRVLAAAQRDRVGATGLRVAVNSGEVVADEATEIIGDPVNGATLLAERARQGDVPGQGEAPAEPSAARRGSAGASPSQSVTSVAPQRRLSPNAMTATIAAVDAAFATHDIEALAARLSAAYEEFDHRTGSTWDREGALTSFQFFMRSRDPQHRNQPLATLGASLMLSHRWVSAEATAGGRFDVGEYESEAICLLEGDGRRRFVRQEVFAVDQLGAAVARLYERYAERIPDGPARVRAAATARTVAAMVAPPDLDRYASALSTAVEFINHRTVGFASGRGADKLLRGFRSLFDVATDIATRVDGVLVLEADALLMRWTTSGTDRASGGAFESTFLLLWRFGPDGLVVHDETFDAGREAEALARLEELVADAGKAPREGEAPAEPLCDADGSAGASPSQMNPGCRRRVRQWRRRGVRRCLRDPGALEAAAARPQMLRAVLTQRAASLAPFVV